MVYIAKDTVECLSPGAILGDTKSIETRRLPIEISQSTGKPVDAWSMGLVVYVDENGYAKPFTSTTTGEVPYGVVAEINIMPANTVVYTNSEAYNTVLVVVSGVIGVAFTGADGAPLAAVGDLVNQFGGKYRPGTQDVPTTDVCVGVCDGVAYASDGSNPTPAVRIAILRFGEAVDAAYPYAPAPTPTTTNVRAYFSADTSKGAPLAFGGSHTESNGVEYPTAVQITPEQCLRFEGFAADSYAAGTIGDVQVSGEIELPYFIPDGSNGLTKPRIARLMDDPNDVTWFIQTCKALGSVGEFLSVVFGAVSKGTQMVKAIREFRGSITGRNKGTRQAGNQLGWVIDPTTNKPVGDDPEPVITGWVTIDIDPQNDLAPASLEQGFVPYSADPSVGHIYGGTDAYVEEITDNFSGIPFFGVCVSEELDSSHKAVFAREGVVNVKAASSWHAGDYIDYMRNPIPDMYEPYIARVGIALTDCEAGAMGAVELNPYDPNEYIVLDHITLVNVSPSSINSTVYQIGQEIHVCSQIPSPLYPDGNYISIRGILRHYDKNYIYDPGGHPDRAIIQVGGYVWTETSKTLAELVGCPVRALGRNWIDTIPHSAVGGDVGFMQLGTVVSTFDLPTQETGTVMVKLDIRHHPQLAVPGPEPVITGREDVRFNIKKVIPLTATSSNKMAFADESDQYFTIEGLTAAIYNDPGWRSDVGSSIQARAITTTAQNLTMNDQPTQIATGYGFSGTTLPNQFKITLNPNGLPDQWDEEGSDPVVGYRIILSDGTENGIYLSAPVYFIMNTTPNKPEEEVTNNA